MRAVAVQRLLGHKDVSVTLNTYTTIFDRYREQEIEKLNAYYMNNDIVSNENLLEESEDFERGREENVLKDGDRQRRVS